MGHFRHFRRSDIDVFFEKRKDFNHRLFFWGFPFHMLYKRLINVQPKKMYESFAGKKYTLMQQVFSELLKGLFYLNTRSSFETNQMFVVAERKGAL